MKYVLIANKKRMDIVGNFMFINDNQSLFPDQPKFQIVTDSAEIEKIVEDEKTKVISINQNDDFKKANKIADIFDYFDLPYAFATEKELESYYN